MGHRRAHLRFGREPVGLGAHVNPARGERADDLRQIAAHEGLAAGQQDDPGPERREVLGHGVHLVKRYFLHIGIGVDDIALLAREIAPRGYVKLHVHRATTRDEPARDVQGRPEREHQRSVSNPIRSRTR